MSDMHPYKLVQPYKRYFQKSKSFLYPALGIKRDSIVSPTQTYICYGNHIKPEHCKLLVLYQDLNYPFRIFEKNILLRHPMFASSFLWDYGGAVYIFDFENMKQNWNHFLNGRYSQLSADLKERIRSYFGAFSNEYSYVDSFLYPDKYFDQYQELLGIKRSSLESVGELADHYDPVKEDLMNLIG